MGRFTVVVNSAFEGLGRVTEFEVVTPNAQLAYEIGVRLPSAQQIADYFAGEYCDSGSVHVNSASGEHGWVARRALSL